MYRGLFIFVVALVSAHSLHAQQPRWARDLGLWLQVDGHDPSAPDARAAVQALALALPQDFLAEGMATHVDRCAKGRQSSATVVQAQYTQCHCAQSSLPPDCTPSIMRSVARHYRLSPQARTVPLSVSFRQQLGSLVLIPRRLRQQAHMGNAQARLVRDCRGSHLQVLAPRLARGGEVPLTFLRQVRGYTQNVTLVPTLQRLGAGDYRSGAVHIASVSDVTRPRRPVHSVVSLDNLQNVVEYHGNTSDVVNSGYMDVSCLPGRPVRQRSTQAVQASSLWTEGQEQSALNAIALTAEELEHRNAYCSSQSNLFMIGRQYTVACSPSINDGLPIDPERCAHIDGLYVSLISSQTFPALVTRNPTPEQLYVETQIRIAYTQHCLDQQVPNEEERLSLEFELAKIKTILDHSDHATDAQNSALENLLNWCARNMCYCRSSTPAFVADSMIYGSLHVSERTWNALVRAESALNRRYAGREEALARECPGHYSPTESRDRHENISTAPSGGVGTDEDTDPRGI